MTKFLIRRVLQAIPTLLGITLLSYLVMVAAPGDPADLISRNPRFSVAQREALAERMGVDQPVIVQYLRWLIGNDFMEFDQLDRRGNVIGRERGEFRGVLRGDFGESFTSQEPALKVIFDKVPATLEITVIAFIISIFVGVLIGILAAVLRGGLFDQSTRIIAVFFSAVPTFWLSLILLLIFGSWLELLPMGSRYPTNVLDIRQVTLMQRLEHLVLPVFVLATGGIATYSRFMRAAVLDTLSQDYVRTARAKGLTDRMVWFRHASRNALLPIATLTGPAIPSLIGGALIVEEIFGWPGVGRTTFQALQQQDYPVVMAAVVITGVGTVLGYILTDILYALIDPRIRFD